MKRKKATKPVGAWAVKYHGYLWPMDGYLNRTRARTIAAWTEGSLYDWRAWYRRGARAVRVTITETVPKPRKPR